MYLASNTVVNLIVPLQPGSYGLPVLASHMAGGGGAGGAGGARAGFVGGGGVGVSMEAEVIRRSGD